MPLKSGEAELEIKLVEQNTNEDVSVEKYKVLIDEDLKVSYEKVEREI